MLRFLVQNWLRQQARDQVMGAVNDSLGRAAGQAAGPSGASGDAPGDEARPSREVDVGIVFAMSMEAGCLVDRLSESTTLRAQGVLIHCGQIHERRVAVAVCGVGRKAATLGTQTLLAGHRPRCVISAGFAGALSAAAARGDIVMADSVVDPEGTRLAIDLRMPRDAVARLRGVHVGRLVTVDQVVARPDDKRALGERHDAIAVDMETSAVAETCRQEHVPFLAIRAISDAVDDELPRDIDKLARQKSLAGQLGAAAGAVWRRPSSVKDMLRLKEQALVASERLAKFLVGVIEQLAPQAKE